MDKSGLRKLIREEVQRELYAVLPGLIKEALASVVAKVAPRKRGQPPVRRPVQEVHTAGHAVVFEEDREFDEAARAKLAAALGYGDGPRLTEPRVNPVRAPVMEVAGVPVSGGLRAHEQAAGLGHMADLSYEKDDEFSVRGPDAVDESALTPAGPEVPLALVKALGSQAKKVLDEAVARKNWRPGMKKR